LRRDIFQTDIGSASLHLTNWNRSN
jgi:hypothetical protein